MLDRPPSDVDSAALVSEYEVFARLPEWVLDAEVSDRAVRLFAVLLRHADRGGSCFPSRSALAKRLRCSTDSVDRAVAELVTLGALGVERNGGRPGEPFRSNTYRLRRTPSRTGAATPSRRAAAPLAARVRNEREPGNESQEPKYSPSTDVEAAPAAAVLEASARALEVGEHFDVWWTAYPRKVGKADALKAYRRAVRHATPDVLLSAAARYRDDPNREGAYTAHPSTWLNRHGWLDEPLPSRASSSSRASVGDAILERAMMDAEAAEGRGSKELER